MTWALSTALMANTPTDQSCRSEDIDGDQKRSRTLKRERPRFRRSRVPFIAWKPVAVGPHRPDDAGYRVVLRSAAASAQGNP